jgi:hypothetical protein
MFTDNKLPTEEQRQQLCELMNLAFIELRHLPGEQGKDLAHAFHNLPLEMYGYGTWNIQRTRGALLRYHEKYQQTSKVDYISMFDKIFEHRPSLKN